MNKINIIFCRIISLCVFISISAMLHAQCGTTISSFPYSENFEANQGGWTTGGTNNDWAWGRPTKTTISSAGSGNKCWVTGGLTASFYKYGERSYVKSPCFDFSGLQHPYISFLIFWDSEHTYDGAVLQSSIDGGTTWVNVGAFGDSVDCMNQNWYNTSSVTYLNTLATVKEGWTGNNQPTSGGCQGGGGSLGWVPAKHCLASLAGQASVVFRFAFGAGTTCNDFDGFAFDSVSIAEAPDNTASFAYTCLANKQIAFNGSAAQCPNLLAWNFGDQASGANNTSTILNPTHTFSAPGSYNISFTASGPCNAPATFTNSINVLSVTDSFQNVSCFGDSNGYINVYVTGGFGEYSFIWNNGSFSSSISNLGAGTYIVTVSESESCNVPDTIIITQPQLLLLTDSVKQPTCAGGGVNGSILVTVSGGATPYHFTWTGGSSAQNLTGLSPGNYALLLIDKNGCRDSLSANIIPVSQISVSAITDSAYCGESNGAAHLVVNGGVAPITYGWTPSVSDSSSASGLATGQYEVTITDATGCAITDTISVYGKNVVLQYPNLGIDTFICPGNEKIALNAGVFQSYFWQDSSTLQHYNVVDSGTFWVVVTDSNGCKTSDTINVAQKCNNKLVVPSAFTPNGDGKNDVFKPLSIDAPVKYAMHIYNRWGELVFESNNIATGWDGNFKGKPQPSGTFIYYIQYTFTGQKEKGLEGAVELLR